MSKELTDDVIKRKHKEFDDDLERFLNELRGGPAQGGIMQRLKQAAARLGPGRPGARPEV